MLTKRQLHTLHEKILGMMQKAGWLQAFFFSQESGWQTGGTPLGVQRVVRLKNVIEVQHLQEGERAPVAFTVFALGGSFAGGRRDTDPGVLDFWRQCCEEIGLTAIAGDCQVFVQIISTCFPSEKGPLSPGSMAVKPSHP